MAKKKKFYAVYRGRKPGVYLTWDACKTQTEGFSGAKFKSFQTPKEAEEYLAEHRSTAASTSTSTSSPTKKRSHEHMPSSPPAFKIKKPSPSSKSEESLCRLKSSSTEDGSYSSFAVKMMAKMGHAEGQGLGKDKQGVTSPIKPSGQKDQAGLGYGAENLNAKQIEALDLAKAGHNVFITGPAGTGKSIVLQHIIKYLRKTYERHQWAVVGPTGSTAIALGGQTIHSFAGCGVPDLVKHFQKAWHNKKQWRRLGVMVMDEASMFAGEFFDNLSDVIGDIRKDRSTAFGGIQLIICGDFLQLPPIPKRSKDIEESVQRGTSREDLHCNRGFAFQARAWKQAQLQTVELDEVFRQSNFDFVRVLHEIRKGNVTSEAASFLQKCNRPLPSNKDGIKPTTIYPRNVDVRAENMRELAKLEGDVEVFEAKDSVKVDQHFSSDFSESNAEQKLWDNQFFRNCIAEKQLSLKVGAQVMLVKNENSGNRKRLVNGSRGKIIGFTPDLPEDALVDNFQEYESASHKDKNMVYPRVKFRNGTERVVGPMGFTSHLAGLGRCIRNAIPLKLAYAISIHKSQGMTLDYVKADVGGVFTTAQTYVALSRASDENGLELCNFSASKVRANFRALAFHDNPAGSFPCWNEDWPQSSDIGVHDAALTPPKAISGCLKGLAFVFTGEFRAFPRDKAEALVKDCGGFVRSAVSGKTSYLVLGDWLEDGRDVKCTTKYIKANQIMIDANKSNLKIVNQKGLFDLITPNG